MTTTTATGYSRTFHGRPDQVRAVRRDVAAYLDGCPAAGDAVLIISEITTNAITHSGSAGESFTVRAELFPDYLWLECEDLGGPWHPKPGDDRPHGLDIIKAIAGPDNWGTETTSDGNRVIWIRLGLPETGSRT